MQAPWIFSSTFLPYTGEPIEFLLEEHEQPMHGTFDNGAFHSRWAEYGAGRVASWRSLKGARPDVAMVVEAAKDSLMTRLKRLTSILSRSRRTATAEIAHNRG